MSANEPIDAAYLAPARKRELVENGQAIKYPWAGNEKTLVINASDIMAESSSAYYTQLVPSEDAETDVDAVHTAIIRPGAAPADTEE